ncbi:DNA/RNA nuclease SfsA [Colwellia sp. UCD-KL20]|uniref:DNA/RNA nuclease SfsA n=1 Tax=Colwellia sp. UCD-KL20 TaxID=1917165 RepID=UPI0009706B87|nr:DNA/RNA nuclease SfsA [Colwellia sp. UCD-KL20]
MTQKISLRKATLIKRYKRFLADVILESGEETTIHVANTGAMSGCGSPGDIIWYSTSENKKRKYPFSWELTEKANGDLICVNTHQANIFVQTAIEKNELPALVGFSELKREVKYGIENSKIDILLTYADKPNHYVEIKSATLLEDGQGYFPDTTTVRGQKHLTELITVAENGEEAVLIFAVMHSGINSVLPAKHLDAKYAELFEQAKYRGVTILEYHVPLLDFYDFTK